MKDKKNRQSNTNEISFCTIPKNTRDIPSLTEKKLSGKDYVFYGDNNDFPQYLWNLYLSSPISSGIINGTIDFVSGNDIIWSKNEYINNDKETISDLIKKIATDFMIYGGFAVQILRNHYGEISELYWVDMQNIRLNSEETKIYYCEHWNKYGSKAIVYDLFDPKLIQTSSIYYYRGHLSRGVYPVPTYVGALADIETSTEIGKFHLSNILNNLTGSSIINFNNGIPSIQEQKDIERKIRDKFTGADNAGKFIVSFNDNKESAVTIERLNEDRMDEKFHTLSKSTKENIFIAFRAYPELFGMSTEGNGFSLAEYEESFKLYNKSVVRPIQNTITRCFETIYDEKNIISFVPFTLD